MREHVVSEETKQRIIESQTGYTFIDENRSFSKSPKVSADGEKSPMDVSDAEASSENKEWIETPQGEELETLQEAFEHIVQNL